jgi:hypothetical protein
MSLIVWKENTAPFFRVDTAWRCSYEELVSIYQIARCHKPDLHCLESLKSVLSCIATEIAQLLC